MSTVSSSSSTNSRSKVTRSKSARPARAAKPQKQTRRPTSQTARAPKEKTNISKEARKPQGPNGSTPNFKNAFTAKPGVAAGVGQGGAKSAPSEAPGAVSEAGKLALQTRVAVGQGNTAIKGLVPPSPPASTTDQLRQTLNTNAPRVGAVGGLVGGGSQVVDGLTRVAQGDLAGGATQTAAGLAHGAHGAFQAKDVLSGSKLTTPLNAGGAASTAGTIARGLGKAAPALSGAFQGLEAGRDIAANGLNLSNGLTAVSGASKIAGAALIASGIGAPVGAALIAGSTLFDVGRWGYNKFFG